MPCGFQNALLLVLEPRGELIILFLVSRIFKSNRMFYKLYFRSTDSESGRWIVGRESEFQSTLSIRAGRTGYGRYVRL